MNFRNYSKTNYVNMKKFFQVDKGFEIKGCFGLKGCPNAITKSENLIKKFEDILMKENITEFLKTKVKGPLKVHHKFKVALSECPNGCSQIYIADFALHGFLKFDVKEEICNLCGACIEVCEEEAIKIEENRLIVENEKCVGCGACVRVCPTGALKENFKGYKIYVGGKLGRHPRLATFLTVLDKEEDILNIFKKVLRFYKDKNIKGERLGTIIEKMGWESFVKILENY